MLPFPFPATHMLWPLLLQGVQGTGTRGRPGAVGLGKPQGNTAADPPSRRPASATRKDPQVAARYPAPALPRHPCSPCCLTFSLQACAASVSCPCLSGTLLSPTDPVIFCRAYPLWLLPSLVLLFPPPADAPLPSCLAFTPALPVPLYPPLLSSSAWKPSCSPKVLLARKGWVRARVSPA